MKWRKLLLLSVGLSAGAVAFAATPVTQGNLIGIWKEKSGEKVYVFGKNHEFEYRYLNLRNRIVKEAGAWEFGPEICALGNIKGNLFTHIGTQRCCHTAYFLGANLVLTSVAPPRFESEFGVCSDRVLVKEPPETETKK